MASLTRKIKRAQSRRKLLSAKSSSLARSARRAQRLGAGAAGALVLLAVPTAALAGSGFTQATQGKTTTYVQTAPKVFNRVDGYNIAADEQHVYRQPSASSIFVQRVIGTDPSSILGQLTANGQVWIMNPNGVLIGSQARVNTAGFMATTLVMEEDDFFAGRYTLRQEGSGGFVINHGTITVSNGGSAILAGASVVNDGVIKADMGEVVLAAGRKMTFDFAGDGLIRFAVDEAVAAKVTGPDGAGIADAVLNAGQVSAGRVTMTGRVARDVFSSVVNNSGVVEATRVAVGKGGEIILSGGDAGAVVNTGTLSASGANGGGSVSMTGETVAQRGIVTADAAKGQAGSVTVVSTKKTELAPGSVTSARGTDTADGGSIVVNSTDGSTDFAAGAVLDASGGPNGGKGGFIEVSAKGKSQGDYMTLNGTINLAGSPGGTLLIDPLNIIVQAGGGSALTDVDQFADPGATLTVAPATLAAVGAGTIVLQAQNDISINSDVTLQANVNLELDAWNDVNFGDGTGLGAVTLQGIGALSVYASDDINVRSHITTASGQVYLESNHDWSGSGAPAPGLFGRVTVDSNLGGITTVLGPIIIRSNSNDETFMDNLATTGGSIDVSAGGYLHFKKATTGGVAAPITIASTNNKIDLEDGGVAN